jgi:hypothetical protein
MSQWTVTIPGYTPTSVNKLLSLHPYSRSRAKRGDYELVAYYAKLAGVPPATGHRNVSVEIILGKGQRAGDPDNYQKCLRDAIKHAGLIVDDSKRWATFTEPVITRGAERGTVITLENVE